MIKWLMRLLDLFYLRLFCSSYSLHYFVNYLQIDNVLMLRAVLKSQKKFASHYADAVDGCGLEQESRLRQRFYSLIRQLVKANNSSTLNSLPMSKSVQGTVICNEVACVPQNV